MASIFPLPLRPSKAATLSLSCHGEATVADPVTLAPSGWWLMPAALLGLGLIVAACLLIGILFTFGGMVALSAASAFCAARLARAAAERGGSE